MEHVTGTSAPTDRVDEHTAHIDTEHDETFELTSVQRDMWFAQQLHPHVSASVAHYLEIRGPIDFELLQHCARTATIETGSLLTRFVPSPGDAALPVQIVDSVHIPEATWVDVSDRPDPTAAAREWMHADYTRPADLMSTRGCTTAFITIGPDHLYWYARAHHTLIDGYGAAVMARRAGEIYTAVQRGRTPPPARSRHPREFLEADRKYRASPRIAKDRAYWSEVVRGLPDPVSLSGRTSAPSAHNHRADRRLDTSEDRAVRDGATRAGTTVSGLVIAAFAAYLGRCTDRDDVVLTLPLAARVSAWMRTSAGMTANAVPLPLSTAPTSTVRDMVTEVGGRIPTSLRHQLLPASEIAGENRVGNTSFGPTVNLMLFSTNIEFGDVTAHLELLTSGPTDDMALTVYDAYGDNDSRPSATEVDGGIRVDLEGNPTLYSADEIHRHNERFVGFLVAFAQAEPRTRLADLAILTAADRRILAAACDGGRGPDPTVLPEIFDRATRLSADRPAVVDGDTVIDYRELDRRSNALGRYLIDLGVGPDTLVAMVLPRSHLSVTAMWAIARAGGAYVPVDPRYPAERTAAIVADSGASVGIATSDRIETLSSDVRWIAIDDPDDLDVHWSTYPSDPIEQRDRSTDLLPDHLAYIVYTSGSTGTPKGVAVTHSGIAAITSAAVDVHDVGRGSRVMHFVSPSFDASVLETILAFGAAGTLVVVPPDVVGGDELGTIIESQCIDSGFITPGALSTIAPRFGRSLSSIGIGGEAVPASLVDEWQHDRRVVNVYGPTETTIAVTLELLRAGEPVSLGRPIPGVFTYVLDRSLSIVPPGCIGELYVGGPGLARGYLGDSARTATRFVADPWGAPGGGSRLYRTGDLVMPTSDGRLTYVGRRDDQVKIRGFRIELGEIEQALRSHASVVDAVVTVHGDADRRRLVAYLRTDGGVCDERSVIEHVSRLLPQFMVPRTVLTVESFPLTVNGKIDRRALPPPPADHGTRLGGVPTTKTEILVAEIMQEEVGISPLGTDDDFFAVGGNSLTATRVAMRATAATGRRIGVRDVFESPTVAGLAARIDAAPVTDNRSWDDLVVSPRPDVVPLSPAQRSMWLLARYDDSPAYHVPLVLRVSGELHVGAAAAAIDDLVARHESLRTVYPAVDGVPRQHVLSEVVMSVTERRVDVDTVASAVVDFASTPFELDTEVPVRAAVFTVGDRGDDHVLALVLHHICVDGSSLRPLARDLAEFYRGRVEGSTPTLPAMPVQYADVTLWQQRALGSETDPQSRLSSSVQTWREILQDLPDAMPLPADRPRPPVPTGRAESLDLVLSPTDRAALSEFCTRHSATEFMAVHTAVAVALARSGAGYDVVVGTAAAGRDDNRLDDVVGMFVNSVVLRTRLNSAAPIGDALDAVRAADLQAYSGADTPFDVLVEHLDPPRVPGRHPLFQVMVSARSVVSGTVELPGATATTHGFSLPVTKYDLEFTVDDARSDGLGITLTHATDLFDDSTARSILHRVRLMIDAMIGDDATPIRALTILTAEELAETVPFGGAPAVGRLRVDREIIGTARLQPDSIALTDGERSMNYAELEQTVTALAHRLVAEGVSVESRVASFVPRSVDSVVALLAVLRSGGACVPVDPAYPSDRRRRMTDDAGIELGLATEETRVDADTDIRWIVLDDDTGTSLTDTASSDTASSDTVSSDTASRETSLVEAPDTSAAYVIYTSGTTGRPKGVVVTHAGLANAAVRLRRAFRMDATARVLAFASPSFDASVLEIVLPLEVGASTVVAPAGIHGGRELEEFIDRHGVTHAFLTPSVLSSMDPDRVPSLRTLGIGGENFGRDLLDAWAADRRIVNVYGPTETTITTHLPALTAGSPVAIDAPGPGVSAVVLDSGLQPVAANVVGELYVSGVQVARGYLDRPGTTSVRFVPALVGDAGGRMYRTGDLAKWSSTPEGPTVRIVGRADSQVKVRGFRIELGEIDAAITDLGGIDVCLTTTVDGPAGEKALVAYVHGPGADETIAARLARSLPGYMIPASIMVLDEVPLTPVGKIDRGALPAPVFVRAQGSAPTTDTERALVEIVDAVLDTNGVGADSDFFGVGGTSLSATRYVARIDEVFGVRVPVRSVFEHPVVADLAREVDALLIRSESDDDDPAGTATPIDDADTRAALDPPQRPDPLPLSPMQFAMWFHNRIPGSAVALNIVAVLRVSGPFHPEAARDALVDVVARHEFLRTVFPSTPDGPVQRILVSDQAEIDFDLVSLDDAAHVLRGRPTEDAAVRDAVRRIADRPFDLTTDVPIRARVVVVSPTDHVLVLVVHHIAADGFSMRPLTADLLIAYGFRSAGRAPEWAAPPMQYADYMLARESAADDSTESWNHWTNRLRDLPDEVTFPPDSPRPTTGTGRASSVRSIVPAAAWSAVRKHALDFGCTPFMVVHAVAVALLARRADTSDVVVGTPVAGRGGSALDSMVGMAVDTLVLRTDVDGAASFADHSRRVRADDLDAFSHLGVSFDALVTALSPTRHPARHPLVQCMIAYEEEQLDSLELGDTVVRRVAVPVRASAFDSTLTVRAAGDGSAEVHLAYSSDLYLPSTASRLVDEFVSLLAESVRRPDLSLDELTTRVGVGPLAPRTLPELLTHGFGGDVSAIAVRDGDRSVTYAELDRLTTTLARCLERHGAGQGDRVAVAMARSLESVVAFCAVARSGAAILPLDPSYPVQRLTYILDDAAPVIGLTTTEFAAVLPDSVSWIDIDSRSALDVELRQDRPSADDRVVRPDDVAYVVYTSGTTGPPKGVEVTHRGLEYFAADQARLYGVDSDSIVLHGASPGFDAAVLELLLALTTGALCVVAPPEVFGGAALAALLARERVTTAFVTPAALATVPTEGLEHLTTVGVGGEAPTTAIVDAWAPGRRMINAYGPSEATVAAAMGELRSGRELHIGTRVLGATVSILEASLCPVNDGDVGEMYVAGPGLARGYLSRPALTATRFVADPRSTEPGTRMYRTGDLARTLRRADGEVLQMTGRVDRQVKIRGMRVEPGEVEAILEQRSDIHTAVVTTADGADATDTRLVAYVTSTSDDDDPDLAGRIRRELSTTVPSHLVPSTVVVLDSMPTTAHGKIDRSRLVTSPRVAAFVGAAPADDRRDPDLLENMTNTAAPESAGPVEEQHLPTDAASTLDLVRAAFAESLGLDHVPPDADFFELGGTSLAVVRTIDRLGETLPAHRNVELDIRWFFDRATPRSIAQRLDDSVGHSAPRETRPAPARLDMLLTLRSAGAGGGDGPSFPDGPDARDEPPLFCIHPAVGLSWTYAGLLPHLDPAIAVHGVQARGIYSAAPIPSSVDEIARDYVNVIREQVPTGPYRLLGWSLGGLIAHSMAVELRLLGEDVELFLMDAYPLADASSADDRSERRQMTVADLVREFAGGEFDDVDDDLTLEEAIAGLRTLPSEVRAMLPVTAMRDDQLRRLHERYQVFVDLGYEHRPRYFDGDMVFFSAATRYGEHGRTPWQWRPYVGGAITDHSISCAHNQMTEPVPLAEIGRRLDGYLARRASIVGLR